MTSMPVQAKTIIADNEGLRLKPYVDTAEKITIGFGRNLTDVGISREEAEYLFENDLRTAGCELDRAFPWVARLDPVRRAVLLDLTFNMGISRLKGFRHTLAALERGDWTAASAGLLASKYARQTGRRALRNAEMIRTGEWPADLIAIAANVEK